VSDFPCGDAHVAASAPASPRPAGRLGGGGRVKDAPAGEPEPRPGLTKRLEEGRQTFQPALWSRLIGIGVVGVYLLLFVVLNTRHVQVSFVFAKTRVSLIWVILLSLAAGLILGVLVSQLHRFRMRRGR
jgi:uncharacterized integral membrane protein